MLHSAEGGDPAPTGEKGPDRPEDRNRTAGGTAAARVRTPHVLRQKEDQICGVVVWSRSGAVRKSLRQPLLPGLGGCPGFGEFGQGLRQWAPVQDAEALGGAGEGDVELGRAAWAVGEDPFWFHDQDGVELRGLRLRRLHRARHTRWPDHDAGAFAVGFVP